jgi:hypothetical protein
MMVALHTIACPRIEVDFLEHWIIHHIRLGVDKIYIYNLGVKLRYDTKPKYVKTKDGVERIQAKRKYIEVDKRSDDHIMILWNAMIQKYKGIVLEVVPDLSMYQLNRGSYDTIQRILNTSENKRYVKDGISWIVNIDMDEYLCGDIEFLKNLSPDVAHVQLAQKVYAERWDDHGFPRNFSLDEHPLNEKLLTICQKNIVRPETIDSWRNVHYDVKLKPGFNKIWGNEKLYFKHFRGAGYKDTAE